MTLKEINSNRPLVLKIARFGLCVMIVSSLFNYYINKLTSDGNKSLHDFYRQGFSSTIVSSNSYWGRSIEFHLKNGLKIYFMPSAGDKVVINDSIQKTPNTYLYNVYRKNNTENYNFVATYDVRDPS
jgi:hypothetical protein